MAMKTAFYAMEYEAWDMGTNRMSLEDEAAYLRLCHWMYRAAGPIENWTIYQLCGVWRCHPNRAHAILKRLKDTGKIVETPEGHLTNTRVTLELKEMETRRTQRVNAARIAGTQSGVMRDKSLELLETEKPTAQQETNQNELHYTTLPDTTEQKGETPSAEPAKAKRATRLKEDWVPSEADIAFATGKGFSSADIEREATRFRNYWVSKPKNATKLSWALTWQNWMMDAPKAKPVPGAPVAFQMKAKPKPRVMLDVATFDAETWKTHINRYLRDQTWDEELLGPDPESKHCHIPKAVLDANGIRRPPITVNLNNGQTPQAWSTTPTPTVPDIEEFTQ